MNNQLIFLRHAKTQKDPSKVTTWLLTEEGEKAAQNLAESGVFDDIDIIITSTEQKAILTATPFAKKLQKEIIKIPELNEIHRGKGEFLSQEEFFKIKEQMFLDLDFTKDSWETSNNALKRFQMAISDIDNKYDNKKILIVSHGTVLSLYFADLLNELNKVMQRWLRLGFCDWGVIENNKVMKDIV